MGRLTLMVLYGGMSEEHPVSVKSAGELVKHIDPEKYDALFVFIGRDGVWRLADSKADNAHVSVINKGLVVCMDGRVKKINVDVAFPMLHGRGGEDGSIQGLLQAACIPYVGCGIAASALSIDKALTHMVAARAGVRVPRQRVLCRGDEVAIGDLAYPLFVKPARSGSSFGVNKVCGPVALMSAVIEARRYDDKVLLEEAVIGSEIGCAVLGDEDDTVTGALDQIDLADGFFRIHQEAAPERGSENATIRVPAPIPEVARARVVETALTVFRALGLSGLARVDMFLTKDGGVVLNEVNTMPGFTAYSRYPRMMEAAGMPIGEVVDRLIAMALKRG